MTDFTLTILGATGYTGRLCVAEAVRRGVPLRIAGRRREALDELAAEHEGAAVSTAVVDIEDREALAELASTSDVLLSTVGPYAQLGQAPVEAAITAGVPYLDVSGEVEFLDWVYKQADRARDAGARLAPGLGFDGVPGDLLASVAAEALGRPVHRARVAYAVEGGRFSAGTVRSILGVLGSGGAAWRNGRLSQEPAGIEHWHAPFPSPPGSSSTISVPFPEVVTLGRTLGAAEARAYLAVPAGATLSNAAGPAQRLTTLLSNTPVWSVLERAVDRLPEGPNEEQRRKSRTVVLAEVATEDGVSAMRWARVPDVYGTTAVIAVTGAQRLADGGGDPGVLTPSQVFDDPAAMLAEFAEQVGTA